MCYITKVPLRYYVKNVSVICAVLREMAIDYRSKTYVLGSLIECVKVHAFRRFRKVSLVLFFITPNWLICCFLFTLHVASCSKLSHFVFNIKELPSAFPIANEILAFSTFLAAEISH